jgi:hypothetical protein
MSSPDSEMVTRISIDRSGGASIFVANTVTEPLEHHETTDSPLRILAE